MPKIICAECKAIEDVEEAPPSMARVLCSKCKTRGSRPDRPVRKTRKNIPRKKHGTRVMLPITCKECGKPDTLDYVPKGANLDEVLCKKCAAEAFGDHSEWARIEAHKQREVEKPTEWEIICAECERKDYLPFKPSHDEVYFCKRCHFEHETPAHERLAGKKKVAGGVFIRRPPKDDAHDSSDGNAEKSADNDSD